MSETMRLEVDPSGIGYLKFTETSKRNPFSLAFASELTEALGEVAKRDDIRVLVMAGEGEHFCGGGDLKEFAEIVGARASSELMDSVNKAALAAYHFPKPLIAAVRGVAFGAGMSLAMAADVMIAAKNARFCQAFVRIGGCPDTGSSWLLQRRVGNACATMLTLTGREVDGVTAGEIGICDQVVDDDAVLSSATELAEEIARHSTFALNLSKKLLRSTAESSFANALEAEARSQALLLQGHDFRDAMAAFAAKRPPNLKDC